MVAQAGGRSLSGEVQSPSSSQTSAEPRCSKLSPPQLPASIEGGVEAAETLPFKSGEAEVPSDDMPSVRCVSASGDDGAMPIAECHRRRVRTPAVASGMTTGKSHAGRERAP